MVLRLFDASTCNSIEPHYITDIQVFASNYPKQWIELIPTDFFAKMILLRLGMGMVLMKAYELLSWARCSDTTSTASCFSQFLHKVQLLCSLRTTTLQARNNFSVRALEVELPSSAQQGMLSLEKPNKQNFMAHRNRLTPGKALARCRQGEENIFLNMI